jgi:hypothetical protein
MTPAADPLARAELYREAGWSGTLPLPPRRKSPPPPGFTGADGRWPTNDDLASWRAEGPHNLAVRLPPFVVGLDVDCYAGKPGAETLRALQTEHGDLPPTWVSTSRTDGSGIRWYRVPHGIDSWPTEAGPGIEIIRYGHRYAVVWPSEHPEGRTYGWVTPDGTPAEDGEVPHPGDLAELPEPWLVALTGASTNGRRDPKHVKPGSRGETRQRDREARAWLRTLPPGEPCAYVGRLAADGLAAARREQGSAYDHTRNVVMALARAGEVGHPGVRNVLGRVQAEYIATVGGSRGGTTVAAGEFERFTLGAAEKILGDPSDKAGAGCECTVTATDGPRPSILVRDELNAVTDEALEAIEKRPDLGVFVRGRMLVTVGRDGSSPERWLKRPPGSPVIVPIETARMLGILDDAATWERWNKRDNATKPARPPEWVAKQILGRIEWPFRYLEAVTETPTLRADGTILDAPGWDDSTGILFEPLPGASWPEVPGEPTRVEIKAAAETILDPVRDFPFIGASDRSAYVAAVLALLARHRIEGPVPMYVVRAPTPATGKTLLAEVVALIGTGRNPPCMTMTFEAEELRKRVTALAVGGTPLVLIDNLSGSVGSDALAAALTATEWEDRILGATQMVRVPLRTVWLATGNNLGFRRTLGRRVIPIDLDAEVEVPEDRTGFRYPDLLGHVRRKRPELVTAALTLLRGFHLAGSPAHGGPRMGSFEGWDDLIRSAVIWAGLEDPATTEDGAGRGRIRAQSDDDLEGLAMLLEALAELFPDGEPFSTAQVIQHAKTNDEFSTVLDSVAAPARGGHATPHSIGGKFRDNRDRPVGERVLRKVNRSWKIEETGGAE